MTRFRPTLAAALAVVAVVSAPLIPAAQARESAAKITERGQEALQQLERTEPRSRLFARHARAVLVFPAIFKAGFVFGGESGDGVLLIDGHAAGFYNLSGGSFGFQAGAEKFSYALFIMNDAALRHLRQSNGFALGTGPSIAIINTGVAAEANSTTLTKDIYAFPFSEKGLMADLTLQGTKVSHIHPN
jgi:lipid-binding SYLF domain-containing protein